MDKVIKGNSETTLGEGLRMFTFREDDNGVCSIRLTLRCCTTAVEESLAPGLFVHTTHTQAISRNRNSFRPIRAIGLESSKHEPPLELSTVLLR